MRGIGRVVRKVDGTMGEKEEPLVGEYGQKVKKRKKHGFTE
jgi:hypothetical protein